MRIFFGATLPEQTKREISDLQQILRPRLTNARFETEDKLHITLVFIGDFDGEKVDRLFSSTADELEKHSRISPSTEIIGMKFFPNEKIRRGIWLDCYDDGSLSSFADSIKTAVRKFGVEPEARAFKAHITIARIRGTDERRDTHYRLRRDSPAHEPGGNADLQKLAGEGKLPVRRFFPSSVALFESTLKPSGSEYRILREYSLE